MLFFIVKQSIVYELNEQNRNRGGLIRKPSEDPGGAAHWTAFEYTFKKNLSDA
jgi:hypothetical protein